MSGFIDPVEPIRARLDRIDMLLTEALRHIGPDALSPTARAVYEDLMSEDATRQERARRIVQQQMAADPLDPTTNPAPHAGPTESEACDG